MRPGRSVSTQMTRFPHPGVRGGWLPGLLAAVMLVFLGGTVAAEDESPPPDSVAAATGAPAGEAAGEKKPAGPATPSDWQVEGYLRTEGRYRHADGDDDLDLYAYLVADAVHEGERRWHARVNARAKWDVVGDQQEGDVLRDYWDGFSGDIQARVYEAFAEGGGFLDGTTALSAGRMFLDEGVWIQYDGLRADVDLDATVEGLDVSGLFGVPVNYGETSRSGDWLAGFVARYRLSPETRFRFEYYHVSEFFEGINDPVQDPDQQPETIPSERFSDDYFGFSAWHRIGKELRLFGRFTVLEGDPNEIDLRGRWNSADGLWMAVLEYYQLFSRLRNVTNDLTPYVPLLGSYEPFWRIGGRVQRRFGDDWIVQAGLSHRELADESDEGTFNHEYNNYYASVTSYGLMERRLALTLIGNGYTSSSSEVVAVGGSADYSVSGEVNVAAGIDYALYKYDYFRNTEHENVWTYWADVRWKQSKKVEFRGRLAIDDDRFFTYTTIEAIVIVRF